jgi:tetratricopeptide (TPR) repeat protein
LRFSIVHAGQSAIENRQSAIIENRQSVIENRSEAAMVGQHHFISYSVVDAEAFALKLADDLQAGPPSFPVWIFRRDLHPAGRDWDAQIRDAIRECDSLIFVMSRDSVTDESNCKPEWTAALKFKKPILLVRYHADAEAPFRLASRQYVDFSRDYDVGLARLRKDLQWLHSPQGELQALKYRLADAKRDYARASDEERPRIQADIEQLQKEIAERERVLNDPDAARKTDERIRAGIEREREPIERVKTTTKFINPPPLTAPPYFQDRHIENRHIANFLRDDSKRLLTINGRSGIGKTAMICRILKSLESGILPDDLGALTVDGIVYLSALGTRPINLPNLFADLCKLLPAETARQLDALYRDPKISTRQKMLALLEQFPHGRVIVLLDNFETVMDVSACCLTDAELDDALRTLLDAPHHAVKVILTTRIPPRDLQLYHPERQAYLPVDEGLAPEYAKQLLRELDADGRVGLKQADDAPLARAVERTRGFPRALEALYAILSADRYTTLEEILAAPLPENVVEALVGEAFARLDALAQRVMQALAAYNRPVPPAAVDYLLQPFLPNINSAPVLQRLVNMQFAHREAGKFYLHPADREYAWERVAKGEVAEGKDFLASYQRNLERLAGENEDAAKALQEFLSQRPDVFQVLASVTPENMMQVFAENPHIVQAFQEFALQHPEIIQLFLNAVQSTGLATVPQQPELRFTQYALLHRAADYFRQTRLPRERWKTLDDLSPQLAEFDLRCAAEDYDTAADVLTDIDFDYLLLWGHYRLMIEMHERVRGKIRVSRLEMSCLNNLGAAYYSTGQIPRAMACYEEGLKRAREAKDRGFEGTYLGNLGNAYADLGETRRAVELYEQALAIAREIGDRGGEGNHLGNLGSGYAALGETRRAIEFYEQALATHREIGARRNEGTWLGNLAEALIDLNRFDEAIERANEYVKICEETGKPASYAYARLALAHLCAAQEQQDPSGLAAARAAAERACQYDVPENNHNAFALLGIIALAQTDVAAARTAFTTAIAQADALLARTPELYDALDARGIALCGIALCDAQEAGGGRQEAVGGQRSSVTGHPASVTGHPSLLGAVEAFRAARKINSDAGIVARVVRKLDALARTHPNGAALLAEARRAFVPQR